ncbi:M15 family metallopeptidase [Aliagarivorans marinus]|uniref:M15 family metallopeptidase n=1 Tax=Aliagarivorans marinus TaxID=561965 RepID=UPI000558D894|nr:M15 family metallopeptidase [Aliagarivorans marinus]
MIHLDISSPAVVATPIAECGEGLVSVHGLIELGPPPESPSSKPYYHLVRQGVLHRLLQAQLSLPQGLRLRLYEGYRSPKLQQQLFQNRLNQVMSEAGDISFADAYRIAARLVAPTQSIDGESLTPPHCSGGAVDVEIIDEVGQVLDFGMEIKQWSEVPPSLCETQATGLSATAQHNRAMLCSVMSKVGFVNYHREWWHFSYGDQYWALLAGYSYAVYGSSPT